MNEVIKTYGALHTAKILSLCPVITFVAGWLMSELCAGTIGDVNRSAAFIALGVSIIMVGVLVAWGVSQWKQNRLTTHAKVVLCLSVITLVGFFILGWNTKID